MILPAAPARAWCEAVARRLRVQDIRPHGTPYLERYFLSGWNPMDRGPGPSVYLHHFIASDPREAVHSHPWDWSASLILVGGYREFRCEAAGGPLRAAVFHPGDVNILEARDRHRIELLERDCWTLFLAGRYQQRWSIDPIC